MVKHNIRPTELNNPVSRSFDSFSTYDILRLINKEDHRVAPAISKQIPKIKMAVDLIVEGLKKGGRLVYVGAGTSGRLGVADAAECIPTFNTNRVIGLLAGAPKSMFYPSEGLEDDPDLAIRDIRKHKINQKDVVVGISAGGDTIYPFTALKEAKKHASRTIAITSNPKGIICSVADISIVTRVGPEIIAGSTRMKAGTSQKLILNMLSTASMVRWGRVLGNRMVNMKITNQKLIDRAHAILMETTNAKRPDARQALKASSRNLPVAMVMLAYKISKKEAEVLLTRKNQNETLKDILRLKTSKDLKS